ncbi:MAG TPA: MoaD/ThiS family protein [Gemmataceae bacterium]|nr:MoaD/ThiS family protein [Gemmataceae bacterium]
MRAGRAELRVNAATVGEALAAIVAACPALADMRRPDGRLVPHYLLSLDGKHFVTDLTETLPNDARLLLLSADAGG